MISKAEIYDAIGTVSFNYKSTLDPTYSTKPKYHSCLIYEVLRKIGIKYPSHIHLCAEFVKSSRILCNYHVLMLEKHNINGIRICSMSNCNTYTF